MKNIWTYLIRDKSSGLYKIGQSVDPYGRLRTLVKQDTLQAEANDYELIEAWWTQSSMEHELHLEFGRNRERGEWFRLGEKEIEEIYTILSCNQRFTQIHNSTFRDERLDAFSDQINRLTSQVEELKRGQLQASVRISNLQTEIEGLKKNRSFGSNLPRLGDRKKDE